jgi:hypothetical protein
MVRVALALAVLLTLGRARAEDRRAPVVVEPSPPAAPDVPRIVTDAATFTPGLVLSLDASNGGDRPGFSIGRARLSLDAEVDRMQGLGGFVALGAGALDTPSPLLDAIVRFRIVGRGGPNLGELRLGQMRVPVSREVLREPEGAFVLPAPSVSIAPGRDTGLLWHVALARPRRRWGLDVGFWNGEAAGLDAAGGSMTSVRLSFGAGDAGRARPGMDWGVAYAASRDAPSDDGSGAELMLEVDGEIRWRALTVAAESISRVHALAGAARGLFGWVSWQLVADTLELRARGEMQDDGEVTHSLTFGVTFFYLAPHLRMLVDYTRTLRGDRTNDGRTVTSFLFLL